MGCDRLVLEDIRLGGSFGYARDDIKSKDNSNSTDIDSYQVTLYAAFSKAADYINSAVSFAYNCYSGKRNIAFPGVNRTASSDYHGRQYGFYLEGGHVFKKGGLELTPLASIKYEHLGTESYTEKDAGALNLRMDRQGYNMVQSGLGGKAAYPLKCAAGYLVPEFHAKWLYDIVNDDEESVSAFTGGGASFATQGYQPARSSADIGARLTLITASNLELSLDYDYQIKKDFYSHSGILNARYSF
jgi:outer membrane autotransporter protein